MCQIAYTKPVYLQIYSDFYRQYFQIWWITPYYAGLLIGRRKKVKFRGIFGDKFVEKSTDFARIFKANFAENQSIKKGRFCGYFLEANRFSADQTSVFNVFLTEVIICSFNNNTLQKWTNGKAFNIMASTQFFAT